MTEPAPKYARAQNLDVHETEDGLIVFDPATDRVHHLNYSAGILFELCQGTHGAGELTEMLQALYEMDAPPAEDVATGLRELVAKGVLVEQIGD